jgi:hypothetical protein
MSNTLDRKTLKTLAMSATLLAAMALQASAESGADTKPPTAPALDAAFVKMSELPKTLVAAELFKVSVTVKNTGSQEWGPQIPKHAVLRPVPDDKTWGTHFIIQGQGKTCKSGQEFTFSSWLRAPDKPGEYVFQWSVARMDRGHYAGPATAFGEPTPRQVIRVEARPAEPPPPAPPAQDPSEKLVLSLADFEYAGSFRVPERRGQDVQFSHSGLALRPMADGSKRMFFNYTLPGMELVELDIPPLLKLGGKIDAKALKLAAVKKEWGRLSVPIGDHRIAEHENMTEIFANGGFLWDRDKQILRWTWWHSYWTGGAPPILAASKLPEDGPSESIGPWFVSDHVKSYWGGVIELPKEFVARYTPGRPLALGFGTGYSGSYPGSLGPSLGAIPVPDPAADTLKVTMLLGYYGGDTAPRDGGYFMAGGTSWMGKQPDSPTRGYCTGSDLVRNAIFIDTPHKHGVLVFYRLQLGRIGYDYGAVTAAGNAQWWYFYDPKDLGGVAKGTIKPGAVVPRTRERVLLPDGSPLPGSPVTGSCYDAETKLLYTYGPSSGRCIHAFRLKD